MVVRCTNLRGALHLEDLDALDEGGARVVDALEHALGGQLR